MTSTQLVSYDSVPALVAYLRQPDATTAVCDLNERSPHIGYLGPEAREFFARSLTETMIDPKVWSACSKQLMRTLRTDDANDLIDKIGGVVRNLIKRRDFEKDRKQFFRAGIAWILYSERPTGLDGHEKVTQKLFKELRAAVDHHRLGILATKACTLLLGTYEVGHGLFEGKPIDVATIDGLFAKKDDYNLSELSRRLPSANLRDEARRRLIRLHIAASQFAEVKADASAIEERLMHDGANPISVVEHPAKSGVIDPQKAPMRGVLVRQDLNRQVATLLGYGKGRPGLSVLPELNLVGALQIEVGLSRPVTLCAAKEALDPSPCILARDVRLDNPTAYIDSAGVFHFVDHISMRNAVDMTAMGARFVLPIGVGGRRVTQFDWRLYYERPSDLTFSGESAGARGPNLTVTVNHRDPARYVFSVLPSWFAVVEAADVAGFHVLSVGGQGFAGQPGFAGSNGSDGGECGSGSDGTNGGPGGPGGHGGDGGDVSVILSCGTLACPDAERAMKGVVYSAGGRGGPGGAGGSGGRGGNGGRGRAPTTHVDENGYTVTDDAGCTGGPAGSNGFPGSNGYDGAPGRPGRVSFRLTH